MAGVSFDSRAVAARRETGMRASILEKLQEIERALRRGSPPIIGRICEGKVLLDLRTVFPDELPELAAALRRPDFQIA